MHKQESRVAKGSETSWCAFTSVVRGSSHPPSRVHAAVQIRLSSPLAQWRPATEPALVADAG